MWAFKLVNEHNAFITAELVRWGSSRGMKCQKSSSSLGWQRCWPVMLTEQATGVTMFNGCSQECKIWLEPKNYARNIILDTFCIALKLLHVRLRKNVVLTLPNTSLESKTCVQTLEFINETGNTMWNMMHFIFTMLCIVISQTIYKCFGQLLPTWSVMLHKSSIS